MDIFAAPKLKIERAKRHIRDLNNEIVSFTRKNPFKVVVEGDAFEYDYIIRVKEEIPEDISCYIGDIIHNLRAALDLLACDLVRRAGGSTNGVYFPFASGADELEAAIVKRKIGRAGQDIVSIIRAMKPYTGGNKYLRAIHDLDIADKHLALIPVATYVGLNNFRITGEQGINSMLVGKIRISPVQDGQCIITTPAASNIKLGQQLNAIIEITFADGQPLSGEPVFEALEKLIHLTDGIINSFVIHCSPR
ncbi:hypothetical protein MWG98_09065 [Klebsiella quasipneumoniae]|uniref:hypothetical protein n=1 Tax=Klebsiella quasipneumoniae TaxID=1463165 RepID=UPI001FF544D9|nr:hypothetical protein [Klebsiella quasipneumoniae]MCJ8556276.1 hypothetical protein [Klebsiella quasipneumoniae]HBQ3760065.1 hypothetical protein [Klebsiella quasipneumoniae subsp. similipneumoniae]